MANIIPGSSQFKEAANRALLKIELWKNDVIMVERTTIGVVLVSGDRRLFAIAPSAKFLCADAHNFIFQARFFDGSVKKIEPQEVIKKADITYFRLDNDNKNVNEMEISEEALELNETIYLFSHEKEGILPPGNVTSIGQDFFRHECPSPNPVEIKTVEGTNVTYICSGGVLLNAAGKLVGIAKEDDLTDRARAMNSTTIIRQLVNNNESLDNFIEGIRGNINLP